MESNLLRVKVKKDLFQVKSNFILIPQRVLEYNLKNLDGSDILYTITHQMLAQENEQTINEITSLGISLA